MAWMHSALLLAAVSGVDESSSAARSAAPTALIDFSTQWCGPCRQMAPIVAQLAAQGYPVHTVDGDQHPELVAKYRVRAYPCFIMLVEGREVDRVEGAASPQRLVQMLQAAGAGGQQPATAARVAPARATGGVRAAAAAPRRRSRPEARAQSPDNVTLAPPSVSFPSQKSDAPLIGSPGTGNGGTKPIRATFAEDGVSASTALAAQAEAPPATAKTPGAPTTDAQKAVAASVRLKIEDAAGNSVGSGTIIDARAGEALVLTCGHIFRESKGQGTIHVDLFGPDGPRRLEGHLVGYDLKRDLGLVSIRPEAPVTAARLAPPGHKIRPGDPVISVGCDNGRDATARASRIASIDKFLGPSSPHGPSNLQVAGQPVEGRSGGGLFTPEGLVIGVCNAADPTDNEGLFAALGSIHSELDELHLSQLIASEADSAGAAADATGPTAGSTDSLAAHEPPSMPRRMPRPLVGDEVVPTSSESSGEAASRGGSPAEAAVLSEIRDAAESAEVICIVRSLADPRTKSEVIVLDRASPEFMRQLSADRRVQAARHLTSRNQQAMPSPR